MFLDYSSLLNVYCFGETGYSICKEIISEINLDSFRNNFRDVVLYYNRDLVSWVNVVNDRIDFICGVY